jgi:uncharacterized protein (TIGR03067 family)
MRLPPHLAILLAAVALVAADKPEKKRSDTEIIQGKWIVVESYHKGEEFESPLGNVLTFSGKRVTVAPAGEDDKVEAAFELRPDEKPPELDMTRTLDGVKDTMRLIYELSNDTLKICSFAEKGRPDAVGITADDERYLMVLKRVKGDPVDAKADDEKILGLWEATEIWKFGEDLKAGEERGSMARQFSRGVFQMGKVVDGKFKSSSFDKPSKFKLDASKNPKQMDLTQVNEGKTEVIQCIYSLNGDTLTLCYSTGLPGRPKAIRKRGVGLVVFVFTRFDPTVVVWGRKWADGTGKFSVEAKLVEVKDGSVHLKRQDGKVIAVPLEKLSEVDQKHVASLLAKQELEVVQAAEAKVIAAIEKLGGKVTVDENKIAVYATMKTDAALEPVKRLAKLRALSLAYSEVTDAGLKHLGRLAHLEYLKLDNSRVTDAGLRHLKGLAKLREIGLENTKITDAGLVHLKGIPNLEILDLAVTQVTDLDRLDELTNLQSLDLRSTKVTDAGLENLTALTKLEDLTLAGIKVSDAGLKHLSSLTNLKVLVLGATDTNDAGVRHLRGLTNMEGLFLRYTQVTDAGLESFTAMTKLEVLALTGTKITDAGLKHLGGLTNLKKLYLGSNRISGAGLERFHNLDNLTHLELSETDVTDEGLTHLKELKSLYRLVLSHTNVSDVGLKHLHGLKNLAHVELVKTKVTDEGVKKLQRALPDCEIER